MSLIPTYGDVSPEAIVDGEIMDRDMVVEAIRECVGRAGIPETRVVSAVGAEARVGHVRIARAMRRLHRGDHAQVGEATEVVGMHQLRVLHAPAMVGGDALSERRLEAVEDQLGVKRCVVAQRHAPFAIVVIDIQRVVSRPAAALLVGTLRGHFPVTSPCLPILGTTFDVSK